ncbi:MAG: hypothetical protein HN790_10095 [Methylococcales bacterium]|jgi:hypothetical protein|nr:hypothetical protein [Methylococcales bacterium]
MLKHITLFILVAVSFVVYLAFEPKMSGSQIKPLAEKPPEPLEESDFAMLEVVEASK